MPPNKANTPAVNATGSTKRVTRSSNPSSNTTPTSTPKGPQGTPKKKSPTAGSKTGVKRKASVLKDDGDQVEHQVTSQYSPPRKRTKKPEDIMSDWFDKLVLANEPDKNKMTSESLFTFLSALEIDPDGAAFLVMVYKFHTKADESDGMPVMFEMRRTEFVKGMVRNNLTDGNELLAALRQWLEELSPDPKKESFIRFFKWCFQYLKGDSNVKAIGLDIALPFLEVLCDPTRYDLRQQPNRRPVRAGTGKFPHRQAFCSFLRELKPVKAINKDQWESFLDFNSTIPWSMEGYDPMESSWPCIYDEYVQYHEKKYPGVRVNETKQPGQKSEFTVDDLWHEI